MGRTQYGIVSSIRYFTDTDDDKLVEPDENYFKLGNVKSYTYYDYYEDGVITEKVSGSMKNKDYLDDNDKNKTVVPFLACNCKPVLC